MSDYDREGEREKLSKNERETFDAIFQALGIVDGEKGFRFRAIEKPRPTTKVSIEHEYRYQADGLFISISADSTFPGDFYVKVYRKRDKAGEVERVDFSGSVDQAKGIVINPDADSSLVFFSVKTGSGNVPQITIYSGEAFRNQPVQVSNNTKPGVKVPPILRDTTVDTATRLVQVIRGMIGT